MTIQQWLEEHFHDGVDIRITPHAHGIRVTITKNWSVITSRVGPTLDVAFNEAIKRYDYDLQSANAREIEKLQEYIEDKQKDIRDYRERIKKLKPKRKKDNL